MSLTEQTTQFDRTTLLALLEASRAVNQKVDQQELFIQLTISAAEVLQAEAASLLRLDAPNGELVFETSFGPAGDSLIGRRMPSGEGIAGQAIQAGHVVRVDDVRQNRNFYKEIDEETAMRTQSLIAAPISLMNETLGVIEVLNPTGRERFSDQDGRVLEIFANLVAAAMRNAQTIQRVSRENKALRNSTPSSQPIGESKAFQATLDMCLRVAPANTTTLILGETGVGKEVCAKFIHQESKRSNKPFIAVNCAALPENLLESELFGHEKGAFTGAEKERHGWFELADGGTLFLDEIGEINASTQVKLLRVLQEREFVRLGGSKSIACDVRVIAATNRNLKKDSEEGRFREDLYYRLNVFPIEVPSLRERRSDIPLLVEHFVGQIAPEMGVDLPTVEPQVMSILMQYDWPGNIRELRNVLERCTLLADGCIRGDHLPSEITAGNTTGATQQPTSGDAGGSALEDHEKALIIQALTETDWNQSAAARKLGITRDVLRYRLKKYDIKQ